MAVIDEGVARAVREKERKDGRQLACRQGCDACCRTHRDIPVYPHEMTGIYWYCVEKIKQPTRAVLRQQLASHGREDACPFLMAGSCIVHPVRPAGCRQFNVFGRPCGEREDPYHTRREDVLTPLKDYTHRAFEGVLSLYGLEGKEAKKPGAVGRVIRTQVVNLQSFNWSKLAARMAAP